MVEFAALLITDGLETVQSNTVTLANTQPNCIAPILFSQYQISGYFFESISGNNVLGQVTATCDGVTSTFECDVSRLSKVTAGGARDIEGYYCRNPATGFGYILPTYNTDGTNNAGIYVPGGTYPTSSENVLRPINEYVLNFRPTVQPSTSPTTMPSMMPTSSPTVQPSTSPTTMPSMMPTSSPTVPIGSGPLVPVYDSCNGLWIAVAHSRNGSQLCVLEEGKQLPENFSVFP